MSATATTHPRRVLIVDDSEVTLAMTAHYLRDAGFDVRTADGFEASKAAVTGWTPDVILADVNMPGVPGGSLCRYFKAHVETTHVPVVLVSSLPEPMLADLATAAGADGYLSKQHGLDYIRDGLEKLCEEILW
jgi:CheY-like chemotaxis protein